VQVRVETSQPWDVRADVLVVPVFAKPVVQGVLDELDRRMDGELRSLLAFGEVTGKRYTATVARGGDMGAGRVMFVGAGDPDTFGVEHAIRLAATAHRKLGGRSVRTLALWVPPLAERLPDLGPRLAEHLARGVVEGGYDPRAIYRDTFDGALPVLDELILVLPGADRTAGVKAAERGVILGEGTNDARNLANRAANDVSPEVLADEAAALANRHGLWIDVIGPEQATAMGMGMFMSVGRGSDNPPRMFVLRTGDDGELDARGRHLALVGKGVCFDTGGTSIKPSHRMEEMKMDKSGACAVLSAIATVARLAPETPLLAVAPAVENMPGPHSTRPGDIVTALNGKRVDVINTDAEGRLILGDAMTYAERLGATHLVEVSTLTGAAARALGHLVSAAFGEPQPFYDEVAAAGRAVGERFWQMPLVDEYRRDIDSWYADVANVASGADAGLIHSALFLREFATRPWVHLDIAGTAYFRKEAAWAPKGATGVSHATLVELALAGARNAGAADAGANGAGAPGAGASTQAAG
jgi:leucyl aminopeptidase